MSFLPEEDQEFFAQKELKFELLEEKIPGGDIRNGVLFPDFEFSANLRIDGVSEAVRTASLLILVPKGYATTKLDSFYTSPLLKRPNGAFPDRANSTATLFDRTWQFWSRHLAPNEWRAGQDGFESYLQYVRCELKRA